MPEEISNANGTSSNGGQPAPVPAPVVTPAPAPQPDLSQLLQRMDAMQTLITELQETQAAPTRALPARPVTERPAGEPMPTISVASRWDTMSIFEMTLWRTINRALGESVARFDNDQFMRALVDKVSDAVADDRRRVVDLQAYRTLPRVDDEAYQAWHNRVPFLRADEAMGSTLANLGDELVPTLLNSVVWREIIHASMVAQLFRSFVMPSNPFDYPIIGAGPITYGVGEVTDQANFSIANSIIPSSTIATDKMTFLAGKWGALTLIPEELVEDSGIDVMRHFADSFRIQMARTWDNIIINGDNEGDNAGNINSDSAAMDPTHPTMQIYGGLRKHFLVDNFASAEDLEWFHVNSGLAIQKKMGARGVFGMKPDMLAMIVNPELWYRAQELEAYESVADVTEERATLLGAQVGQLKGVGITPTDLVPLTNQDGTITVGGGGNTLSTAIVARRDAVLLGLVRTVRIEALREPGGDGRAILSTARGDVRVMQAGAVGGGINIDHTLTEDPNP